jgi:hypothetical protein
MSLSDVRAVTHWEDTDLVVMSRVKNVDGDNVTQASISSITCKIYNRLTGELVGTESLTVSSVVFNTLQTDDPWDEDSTGYNFRYTVSGSYFPDNDVTYRVEVTATPTSGSTFLMAAVDVEITGRFSS